MPASASQVVALTPVVVPHRNASQSFQPDSYTNPGSAALFGCTCPAPCMKMISGSFLEPSLTS